MEERTPKELAALLKLDCSQIDFTPPEEIWEALFIKEEASFFQKLEALPEGERYPLALRIYLRLAASFTAAAYRKHQIPEDIFLDTLSDITIWTGNCLRDTGIYGLRQYHWLCNHLKLRLVRLGRLQFEPIRLQHPIDCHDLHFEAGAEVLNVHVPQGEPLDYAACQDSYRQAMEFYGINRFVCGSWLLSPKLNEILPKTANILQFQQDYTIHALHLDSRQCEERVFLRILEDPQDYPEDNTLQAGVKRLLLKGEQPGSAEGAFLLEPLPFRVNGSRQFRFMERLDYVRVVGTEGEARGEKALLEELTAFGIKGWTEEFDFYAYDIEEAIFEVTAPYQKRYSVTGYGLTGNGSLEAPLYYAETADEINLSFVRGKFVMINTPARAAVYKKLVRAGAVGFLTIFGSPFDDPAETDLEMRAIRPDRHLTDDTAKIPGATIRYRDAAELLERNATEIRFTLRQKEAVKKGRNVVAEIPGNKLPEEILVFTAHYDSTPFSPGAYDNSAGCSVILEALRYFQQNPPARTVRFLWLSGEEIGLVGSTEYVQQHQEELQNIKLCINVDLAGHLVGSNFISATGDISILHALSAFAKTNGFPADLNQEVSSSDSSSFADGGVPAIGLRRSGFGGHNRLDLLSLISPPALEKTASFLCLLGHWLANAAVFPFVREMPENMRDGLARYFGRID